MWHHKFDPNSIDPLPLAQLQPLPRGIGQRSESISDFLHKSQINRTSLVGQALEKVSHKPSTEPNEIKVQNVHTRHSHHEPNYEELSKKFGLSVETLKQIMSKENAIKEKKREMERSISVDNF